MSKKGSVRSAAAAPPEPEASRNEGITRSVIAWSTLAFAILQSVCTFFAALDGLRLLIGIGSLAAATQVGVAWDHFHTSWIRVPMILFALAGSLLNLVVLGRIRRLRNRPASQWRQPSPAPGRLRMERLQFVLSLLTLALVAIEEIIHLHSFHHL